jgi:hypothetical protein
MARKCIIEYTLAKKKESGDIRYFFDKLVPCCDTFKRLFEATVPHKTVSFQEPVVSEVNGMNLVTRGGIFKLVLRLELPRRTIENEIKFCQSCKAEIRLKCTQKVDLKPKYRKILDGYDVKITWKQKYLPLASK